MSGYFANKEMKEIIVESYTKEEHQKQLEELYKKYQGWYIAHKITRVEYTSKDEERIPVYYFTQLTLSKPKKKYMSIER